MQVSSDTEASPQEKETWRLPWIVDELVKKLEASYSEEDNLNSAFLLSDMIELKAFFPIIASKNVVNKLFELMLQDLSPTTHASRNNALFVLNSLCKWM